MPGFFFIFFFFVGMDLQPGPATGKGMIPYNLRLKRSPGRLWCLGCGLANDKYNAACGRCGACLHSSAPNCSIGRVRYDYEQMKASGAVDDRTQAKSIPT